MTDDGWEDIPPPQGRKDNVVNFAPVKEQIEVRKAIEHFRSNSARLERTHENLQALLERAVLAEIPEAELNDFKDWCKISGGFMKGDINKYHKDAVIKALNTKRYARLQSGDYRALLQQSSDGRSILSNSYNIGLTLSENPAFKGYFRFDEFRNQVTVVQRPPWMHENILGRSSLMNDAALTDLTNRIQEEGLQQAKRTEVHDCLASVAKRFKYNSLTDYLDSVQWDGVGRINNWLVRYCGAENTTYSRLAGRMWLLSAAARAYDPGCKVDHVLLLQSPQGYKKSTLWLTIARRPEWFLEYTEDINTKEGKRQVLGKWIIVLPELAGLRTWEVQHVKAFITRLMDNDRAIYEKYFVDHPRTFVLCGDTNDDQLFTDVTGNRRYWLIICGKIDIDGLEEIMDQIWAEAVYYYKHGDGGAPLWWPETGLARNISVGARKVFVTSDEIAYFRQFEDDQKDVIEMGFEVDPWESLFADFLKRFRNDVLAAGGDPYKIAGVAWLGNKFLGIADKDIGQHSRRINKIMKRLGWKAQPVRIKLQGDQDAGDTVWGFKYIKH